MKEINLITRNSKYYVIWTSHKLSKLLWQKKKCCDYKSWKYFFTVRMTQLWFLE